MLRDMFQASLHCMRSLIRAGNYRWLAPALLVCSSAQAVVFPDQEIELRDPHYGMVLFEAYQENYFSAAVKLLVSRDQQLLEHHQADSRLLLGDLYLSYGLYADAERVLRQLIDEGVSPQVSDRAWFYLGKIHFQKQQYRQAEQALDRVGNSLEKKLQEELYALRSNILMRQGKYSHAAGSLSGVIAISESAELHFARFNLGVAHIHSGNTREGIDLLRTLGKLETNDAELKSLRDKANLVLAFLVLKRAPLIARDFLRRIRIDGPFANRALLGLAWAEVERENYPVALAPLQELGKREHTDMAVMESMLLIANILERMQASPQALQAYQRAVDFYEAQLDSVESAAQTVRDTGFPRQLLADTGAQDASEAGWSWEAGSLPGKAETSFLFAFMAGNEFHETLKELRDLKQLRRRLTVWHEDMPAYTQMLFAREQDFPARLQRLQPEHSLQREQELRQWRDTLAGELQQVEQAQDAMALATAHEQQLLQRLEDIRQRSLRLQPASDASDVQQAQRFYRGLLSYQIETDYVARFAQLQAQLADADELLSQADGRKQALRDAREQMPQEYVSYRLRVARQAGRIAEMQLRVDALIGELEQQLQEISLRELETVRARLRDYLDSARFSLAFLQDRLLAQEQAKLLAESQAKRQATRLVQ